MTSTPATSVPFQIDNTGAGSARAVSGSQGFSDVAVDFSVSNSSDIRLSGYQSQTIPSAPGSTVALDLQNFTLTGHSTLTLLGDTSSTFIINVTNHFSLAGSAKVVLAGALQWNQVFFNIVGTGPTASLGGKSILFGTITASQRTLRLNGHTIVYGTAFARQLVTRQAAQFVPLPIVSQ